MKTTALKLAGASLGVLILLQYAQNANAQSAPAVSNSAPAAAPNDQAGDAATSSDGLEEVIVTAEKREEKIRNVPMSITAIKGDSLKQMSLYNFQDIADLTSGLDFSNPNGQNQTATIRGISFNPYSGAGTPLDLYVDDVVTGLSDGFRTLFDVSQIEILRGPTGSLFGKTSPAGAITITTHRPDMNVFDGYFSQTYTDRDFENTEAAVNIPILTDMLAIRISGVNEDDHGFLTKDLLTGKEELNHTRALRESILYRPTDDLEITLIHLDQTSRSNNYPQVVGPGNGTEPPTTPDMRATLSPQPVDYTNRQDKTTLLATYNIRDGLDLHYIGNYSYVETPSYVYNDPTNTIPAYANYQNIQSKISSFTQEARLQSSGNDLWNYLFGVYYTQGRSFTVVSQTQALIPFVAGPPQPPPLAGLTNIGVPLNTKTVALYTNQSFQVTDSDVFQVSARWTATSTFEQARLNVVIPTYHLNLSEPPLIAPQNQRPAYYYPTGGANFTHHFDENWMAYAAWSHGFRTGGVNVGVTQAGADSEYVTFKSEFSDEFEIGSKGTFFDHRLNVSADIFHQQFHGFQGSRPAVYWRPGNSGPFDQNITAGSYNGNASTEGIEFQLDALITPDWRASFSGAYADAHYNDAAFPCNDQLGIGVPNNAPPGVLPVIHGNRQTSFCVLNSSISTAPPWSLSFNTEYDFPVLEQTGFIRALATFRPAYSIYGSPPTGYDPEFFTNLYLGIRDPSGKWEFQVFAKNLFDTVIQNYGAPGTPAEITAGNNLYDTGYRLVTQNPPREVGFTLRYNFGE